MQQGVRLNEIFSSVEEGDYSIEGGAQKAEMGISEFESTMIKAGYKVPAGVWIRRINGTDIHRYNDTEP